MMKKVVIAIAIPIVIDVIHVPPSMQHHVAAYGFYAASVGDYMKFIRMWLNDGQGPRGRVLKQETVESAVRNGGLRQSRR